MNNSVRTLRSLNEKYIHFTHASGLKVYLLPKDFPDYFISIGVDYGSFVTDVQGTYIPYGTAHFMEHMMFHTSDGGDITDAFAKYGSNVNAYTTNEYTAYFCYGTKGKYNALSTLLNMMLHPCFETQVIENESKIIEQEIAMYMDDPMSVAYRTLMQCLYPTHPIRNDIAGSAQSIREISGVLLEDIHRYYYAPNNMTLVLAGRFDQSRVEHILNLLVPNHGGHSVLQSRPSQDKGSVVDTRTLVLPLSRPIVMLGYKDPIILQGDAQSKRGYIGQIACNAIFSKSGELYHALFEKGLCGKDFGATYEWSHGCAHILINASTNSPNETLDFIKKHIDALPDAPPTVDAFERAKNVVYADTIRVFDSIEDLTMDFLEESLSGGDFFDIPERLASITYQDLISFINEIFGSQNSAVVRLHPKENTHEET